MGQDKLDTAVFCNFVASRIRLQLVYDIDKKNENLLETQLFPDFYAETCDITNKFIASSFL